MKIIGFSINKLSIERKNPPKGELNVQNKLDIENISSEDLSISKDPGLKFDFCYEISYEPSIAKLEIKGSVITIDNKNESSEILKEWKDKKIFNHPSKIDILNFILNKSNLKAFQLEDEIGLPLHLPMPKIESKETKKEDQKAKYTG
jgi:hypothetical protein